MAASSQQIVARIKSGLTASAAPPSSALVAASAPVKDPAQIFRASGVGARSSNWQAEAWQMLRVGELAYYVGWRANACSRVRLVASEIGDDGYPTGGIAEDDKQGKTFADMVRSIAGGPLGQAELTKRAVKSLTVPGELWIAILQRPEGVGPRRVVREKWFAVNRSEMTIAPGTAGTETVVISLPDGQKHEFNPQTEGLFRVWEPDAEKASEATSPVKGCLDPLREIVRTTAKIRNIDNSRLIGNGMLFISQEASLPSADAPVAADKPGGPPDAQQGQRAAASLQQQFVKVAQTAYTDPDSMAGLVPIVISVPEVDKAAKHVDIGKDFAKQELDKRNDAIARLAMGLDVSPERLLGIGETSNHWSAWAVEDQDVQLHITPVMQTICQAIYDNVLRAALIDEGIDPDRYTLWFDTSQLTVDPDKTEEATTAHERGAMRTVEYLKAVGLPEDAGYDLTTIEGYQQLARDWVMRDPTMIRDLLPLLDPSIQGLQFPEPQPRALPRGADDDPDDDDMTGAQRGREPDTEGDEPRPVTAAVAAPGVDRAELAAVDLLVSRALELAGKRRFHRGRDEFTRLRDVEPRDYHRFMEPVDEAEVARLIKGWDAILTDEFARAHGLDVERVRAAVLRIARRELTSQIVDGELG